jgi:hypothetical protein
VTESRLDRRDLRRRGWHEWRAAVPGFLPARRGGVLAVVSLVVGSVVAVLVDLAFSGLDDLEWAGSVRVVGTIGFASVAVALAIMATVAVWLRHDRRKLEPVSWRDDRLVVDYSTAGAPELSSTLAPRLLASARKQHLDLTGSVTGSLGMAGAFALGLGAVIALTVGSGFPGLGFSGTAVAMLTVPFTLARSLEGLGRAAVAIDLAEAHTASPLHP